MDAAPKVPPIIGAALSVETARWCGRWADGLITVNQPPDRLRQIVDAFAEAGGEGKPVHVQVKVAWAPDEEDALAAAYDQWRTNVFDSRLAADLERVEQFEEAARHVRPEDVRAGVLVTSHLGRLAGWLQEILDAGAADLYVHHVPKEQPAFIEAFAAKVLPDLTS